MMKQKQTDPTYHKNKYN